MANLEDTLAYWQERLRLNDWEITLIETEPYNIDSDALADIDINEEHKSATIRVTPKDFVGQVDGRASQAPRTQEQLILHELLHIYFKPFNTDEGSREAVCEEQAINMLVGALME